MCRHWSGLCTACHGDLIPHLLKHTTVFWNLDSCEKDTYFGRERFLTGWHCAKKETENCKLVFCSEDVWNRFQPAHCIELQKVEFFQLQQTVVRFHLLKLVSRPKKVIISDGAVSRVECHRNRKCGSEHFPYPDTIPSHFHLFQLK